MAFVGLSLCFTVISVVILEVTGQYQMPIPYQQVYQQPYLPNPYQQGVPYPGYSYRPYVYPQTGYQMPYYPYGGYPQRPQGPLRLPEGYRVEPLLPGEMMDENAIVNSYQNQRQLIPAQSGYNMAPSTMDTTINNQVQPEPPKPPTIDQAQSQSFGEVLPFNQPQLMQIPLTQPVAAQPKYTVEIVTSKPAEYTVHKDSWSTKFTNNNNSFVIHKVENKPYSSTIRRVFTTDGDQSGYKVYTMNIVNGVEVTTTEDPNAIIPSENRDDEEAAKDNVADDLEENNTKDEDEKEESEKSPSPVFNWFS